MDASRFDSLTRLFARRLSRRDAVRTGGTGVVATLGAAGLRHAAAQEAPPAATPSTEHISLLFVQTADSGTFVPKSGAEGVYVLTLTDVAPHTIQFSDRPARLVGTLPTEKLVDGSLFDPGNPPNAALIADTPDGQDALVVELRNPHYDAATGTLTYDATVLKESKSEWVGSFLDGQIDDKIAESFAPASLFIDSTPIHCIPGGGMCFPIFSQDGCCPDFACLPSFPLGQPQCQNSG